MLRGLLPKGLVVRIFLVDLDNIEIESSPINPTNGSISRTGTFLKGCVINGSLQRNKSRSGLIKNFMHLQPKKT